MQSANTAVEPFTSCRLTNQKHVQEFARFLDQVCDCEFCNITKQLIIQNYSALYLSSGELSLAILRPI